MALILIQQRLTQPTTATATGSVRFVVNTAPSDPAPSPPVSVSIPGFTSGPVALTAIVGGYEYVASGLPAQAYTAVFTALDTSTVPVPLLLTVPFELFPAPSLAAGPPAIAAAHLPMLLALEAEPTGSPLQAAVLLLVVEVKRGANWVEAGRLRGVCDATSGQARFDLSEYLKTQFTPTPPDESGNPDPALGVQYRVRYGRAPFDGTAGDEAGIFAGLAVNAAQVVNPSLATPPLPLGPVSPYAGVSSGYARFRSIASADGVRNVATVPVSASACPARQFVWLHPSGAWVWGLFGGRHEHGLETGDDVTVRRPTGDYQVGGGDVRDTLRVYSDKLDWPTFQVLRSIRRSRRVYERLDTGLYVPVLMEKGSFPEYQETAKTFEVNFTARYPVQTVQTF